MQVAGLVEWGLAKGGDAVPTLDAEKTPFVLRIFELYASGQHTDRTLAEWLNVQGQRTTRGRLFTSDTVREMLCNAAYCGYVSGRRDRSKAIKGLHEAIVPEELFDRVQLMRRERARTLKPGRPSPKYVLRGLARCKRCHANMQGTSGGRDLKARYYCATRRANRSCDQPIIPAEQSSNSSPGSSRASRRTRRHRRRSCAGSPTRTRPVRTARPASAAPHWRSACGGCATSTSSATCTALSTSPAATRSTPSYPRDQARAVLEDSASRVQKIVKVEPDVLEDEAKTASSRSSPSPHSCRSSRAAAPSHGRRRGKVRERRGSNPRLSPRDRNPAVASKLARDRRVDPDVGPGVGGRLTRCAQQATRRFPHGRLAQRRSARP